MDSEFKGDSPVSPFEPYIDAFNTLIGREVVSVHLEQWSVGLVFDNRAALNVSSDWLYRSKAGDQIDQQSDLLERQSFDLWKIVGRTVHDFTYNDIFPPTFLMRMDDDSELVVYSSDDGYEDWSLVAYDRSFLIFFSASEV